MCRLLTRSPLAVLAFLVLASCRGASSPAPGVSGPTCPALSCLCGGGPPGSVVCDGAGVLTGCACRDGVIPVSGTVVPPQAGLDGAAPPALDDASASDIGGTDVTTTIPDAAAADAAAQPDLASAPDSVSAPDLVSAPDAGVPDLAPCPPNQGEVCDGADNDCNGLIDDGQVCPDDAVASYTLPFDDGVYLVGDGSRPVQRFWPTRSSSYYPGSTVYARHFAFRRTDWQLFYLHSFQGLIMDDRPSGQEDTVVATPGCQPNAYGFDGEGTLYHSGCGLRRQGVEIVKQATVSGVLADGRVILPRTYAPEPDGFVVVDRTGRTLSVLTGKPQLAGKFVPLSSATTVRGNDAFVVMNRSLGGGATVEQVIFRLTERSEWLLVRRVPVARVGTYLAISDGTLFLAESDPTIPGLGARIVAFPPDPAGEVVAWREHEAPVVRFSTSTELLVGPREPQGPLLEKE